MNEASNDELGGMFDTAIIGDPLPLPSGHIHITDPIRIVMESKKEPGRRLEGATWAIARPRQAQLLSRPPIFNIRAETAHEKFGWALAGNRALIPAQGYWEWTGEKGHKTPYYFHPEEGDILAFAGLYSWWADPTVAADDPKRWHLTAAILTMDAAAHLATIHDRNPVMLPQTFWRDWLDPQAKGDEALTRAATAAAREVTDRVRFDQVARFGQNDQGPALTTPVA